ncbi:MAG: hypothetical protein MUC33_01180 [Desulfobacterales bacterium]|nr:hypothetical protein [Desulfobacterales bacterium]MCU0601255.1 hypothetical protein [Desulfobacterales bacterium]
MITECEFTERRRSDGRRWIDVNGSCIVMAYAVFTFFGFAAGGLVGYAVAKLWG